MCSEKMTGKALLVKGNLFRNTGATGEEKEDKYCNRGVVRDGINPYNRRRGQG